MTARQTAWPHTWLMTDERLGARLWEAIDRLPENSGVVFRHYALGPVERLSLADKVASTCRSRGFALAVAADADLARVVGADLIHNPPVPTDRPALHQSGPFARRGRNRGEERCLARLHLADLRYPLSPWRPVAGSRGSRPNRKGSATKLRSGAMDFSIDGPVLRASAVAGLSRARSSSQKRVSDQFSTFSSVGTCT